MFCILNCGTFTETVDLFQRGGVSAPTATPLPTGLLLSDTLKCAEPYDAECQSVNSYMITKKLGKLGSIFCFFWPANMPSVLGVVGKGTSCPGKKTE